MLPFLRRIGLGTLERVNQRRMVKVWQIPRRDSRIINGSSPVGTVPLEEKLSKKTSP